MKNNIKINPNSVQLTDKNMELVNSGDDYFNRLIHLISNAQTTIHLQTYIFEEDETGITVANELIKAASRNVTCYVLLDGYGSSNLSIPFINHLKLNGVNIRFFSPLYFLNLFYLGRRLHHKIVVVDSKIALIGGINISNQYRGTPTEPAWLDYAVELNDHKIADYLQQICLKIFFKEQKFQYKKINNNCFEIEKKTVRILQNDWLKRKSEINNAYFKMIRGTQNELIILGSYFLPGKKLFNTLKKLTKNKVSVHLILAGISDVPFTRRATCYLYASLLKNNIALYEWKNSILHAKVALSDNELCTIGSFNLNHLSSYGSLELNVEINSNEFTQNLKTQLFQIMAQSEKITPEIIKSRNGIFNHIINWMAYHLIRLGMILITYFPFKKNEKI